MNSINIMPLSNATIVERPAPPPGKKCCACGCGGFLPTTAKWNVFKGHGAFARKKAQEARPGSHHLAASITELLREIGWRERRQTELEQEVGVNRQKLVMLRQSLQALQAIQGGGPPQEARE
jgi:hypothetical protein